MHQPVEDGVGHGRIVEPGVPVLDRQLAGDDGRARGAAIDHFQQVMAAGLIERRQPEAANPPMCNAMHPSQPG